MTSESKNKSLEIHRKNYKPSISKGKLKILFAVESFGPYGAIQNGA